MPGPFDFTGKVVFVSGGTSGINLGIAEGFARAGATMAVMSRSQPRIDEALERLRHAGAEASGHSADVRDYAAVDRAVNAVRQQHGLIDVVVSGAAGNFPATAERMSANAFRAVVDIDLLGTFNVLRASFPHLRKPGASIINVSAPQAAIPSELQMHVSAAKAGVDMITRVGALEWGRVGLRVNSVIPGMTAGTEGMRRLNPTPELEQVALDSIPLGRFGDVDDVAECCLWLASPHASYVTGAVIPVDGGVSLAGFSVTMAAAARRFRQMAAPAP
jgi:NAD(P)-dependent dehydrogenase (short-subunit alcohol dehydrogenase family)